MKTEPEVRLASSIHTLSISDVFTALVTDLQGLAQAEAEARLRRAGPNAIVEITGKSPYLKSLANFTHLMAILLWAGGVAAFVAHMPQLGIAIWLVNVINGVFSYWQEYKAEKAAALRKLLPTYARVLRDGAERRILAEELVSGDILLLFEGGSHLGRRAPGSGV
jgi:P-type Ca2+ transporter type 2C